MKTKANRSSNSWGSPSKTYIATIDKVLSRRGLLRYLYQNIEDTRKGDASSIFELAENGNFNLKPGLEFHFFSSHVPCGDASIIPMLKRKPDDSDCLLPATGVKKLKAEEIGAHEYESKDEEREEQLVYEDVHRTGGKCIAVEDPHGPGHLYHTLGAVRTKPGRGEPTLSLSCSDKIAKWIYCGVQGALLSLLLNDSIHIKSITIGGGGQFCLRSMERALIIRCHSKHCPTIRQSSIVFPHSRYSVAQSCSPCANSIIWCDVKNNSLEVSVEGRRHGTTKKCRKPVRLKVSKMELFIIFVGLTKDKFQGMTYEEVKAKAKAYYLQVIDFKKNIGCWSTKPNLLDFLPDI